MAVAERLGKWQAAAADRRARAALMVAELARPAPSAA